MILAADNSLLLLSQRHQHQQEHRIWRIFLTGGHSIFSENRNQLLYSLSHTHAFTSPPLSPPPHPATPPDSPCFTYSCLPTQIIRQTPLHSTPTFTNNTAFRPTIHTTDTLPRIQKYRHVSFRFNLNSPIFRRFKAKIISRFSNQSIS